MTVIVVTKVSTALRGYLTRWMLELKPGVFVGSLSRRVRDWLWARVKVAKKSGACVLTYATRCEQGFRCEMVGDPRRALVDVDGMQLVRRALRCRDDGAAKSAVYASGGISQGEAEEGGTRDGISGDWNRR